MNLSIIYFVLIFFLQLLLINTTELINQCPTSRRLLLFGNLKLPFGEKKSSRHSPRSITYIQPQTSQELGKKVRSYTHLLKPKLFSNEEKFQLKRLHQLEKKKTTKKKDSIEHTKTKDLIVPINKQEFDRCRSLLQIDEKKPKKTKRAVPIASKLKNATNQLGKPVKKKVENAPATSSKVKPTKKIIKTEPKFKVHPTENLKYKPTKPETITIIEQIQSPFDEQNNSAVNRAFYFVKNMFQLSEQSSDENEQIVDLNTEQYQTRKLLSVDEYNHPTFVNLPKRRLLTTKSKPATTKKDKKSKEINPKDANKPKVGWAYRYRISRYLEAQKTKQKRTGREKKSNQPITKRKLLQFDSSEEEQIDSNEL